MSKILSPWTPTAAARAEYLKHKGKTPQETIDNIIAARTKTAKQEAVSELLTVKEAAALLKVSRTTATRMCEAGVLVGAVRFGHATNKRARKYGSWRVPKSAIAAFLKNGANGWVPRKSTLKP